MKNYCVSIVFIKKRLFKKNEIVNTVAIAGGLDRSEQAIQVVKETILDKNPKFKNYKIEIESATEIPYGL